MSGYRVLIVIKGQWWSDQVELRSYAAAQRHRNDVASRWNDCDTAIAAPDGRVLAYEDSLVEQAAFAAVLASDRAGALAPNSAAPSRAQRARPHSLSVPTKTEG